MGYPKAKTKNPKYSGHDYREFLEVVLELRGVGFAIGAADVAVRADEIGAIALEAGFVRFVGPRKFVEREVKFSSEGTNFGSGLAVDMKLPIERLERVEIAGAVSERNPWEAVATAKCIGIASTERTVAILDGDLRGETEKIFASGGELNESREDVGKEETTDELGEEAATGDAGECAIGGSDQRACEGETFGFVAIENFGAGSAGDDRC